MIKLSLSELRRNSLFELQVSVIIFKSLDDIANYASATHLMSA